MADTADPVVVAEGVKEVADAVVETVNETLNATAKTVSYYCWLLPIMICADLPLSPLCTTKVHL